MTSPKKRQPAGVRRRAADAPVVLLALDSRSTRPLHRQVYDGLRESIVHGRLLPGARLPSTRALAADLGVARTTVTLAFDQLRAEGYLLGRRGGGTRVRGAVPDALLHVGPGTTPRPSRAPATRTVAAAAAPPRLSTRGESLVTWGSPLVRRMETPPKAFRLGLPAVDLFPSAVWARLTARRWRNEAVRLGDGDPGGELALREAIAAYLTNSRGARCTAAQVLLVSGTQQAIDLVARVLVDSGESAWMEDPGYTGARQTLVASGLRVVPVPVDADGLDVSAGERAAPDARLAYVTPSHQFPLGAVLSAPRRLALLAWARRADAWVIEDDYDSEFRYAGRPLLCLQGLDAQQRAPHESGRVLYIGTFSKSLVPGLRLGYLVVPETLADVFRAARAAVDRHAPTLLQGVLADFIGEGHYARHVRRVRALYAERQAILLAAADRWLNGLVSLTPDVAGLHLVGWLPAGVSDIRIAAAARKEGVEAVPLSRYFLVPRPPTNALLLSYAAFNARAIEAGVKGLRRVFDEQSAAKDVNRER